VSFATAFQANAFQNNAFQIYIPPPSTGKVGGDDAWTEDDLKKLRKLSAKIAERQRKLNQAIKDSSLQTPAIPHSRAIASNGSQTPRGT